MAGDAAHALAECALDVAPVLPLGTLVRLGDDDVLDEADPVGIRGNPCLSAISQKRAKIRFAVSVGPNQLR